MDEVVSNSPMTVAEYTLNALREKILEGNLATGSRVDQQALADELGVSLIPIRESLRKLEAEGLVEIYPHKGAFVAEISVAELKELYLIREVLEELATELAVPNLTSKDLDRLEQLLEQMQVALETQDHERLLNLNRTYHFTIYEASGRSLLGSLINSLWDRSRLYRHLYIQIPERAQEAHSEHRLIYTKCKSGDAAGAGQAVRDNVRRTVEGILDKSDVDKIATP